MKPNILPFNPKGPKVSTRRMRKVFGRFSREGHDAKSYELNYKTNAHAVSLANVEALYSGKPLEAHD
jgi:hypothetical protein